MSAACISLDTPAAQPWLKSWGEPRRGSQHRDNCLGVGCEGGRPSSCEGPGVSSLENFWKLRC